MGVSLEQGLPEAAPGSRGKATCRQGSVRGKKVWSTPESKGGAQGQGDREEMPHYHREYSYEFVNIHETSPTGLGEAGL